MASVAFLLAFLAGLFVRGEILGRGEAINGARPHDRKARQMVQAAIRLQAKRAKGASMRPVDFDARALSNAPCPLALVHWLSLAGMLGGAKFSTPGIEQGEARICSREFFSEALARALLRYGVDFLSLRLKGRNRLAFADALRLFLIWSH